MLGVQSCKRNPFPDVPVTQNVTFDKHIKPITSTVCIDCHSSGSRDYSRYQNAYFARYSIQRVVVHEKSMPLGRYMSDETRALFRDWIDQGANK